jgi:hypothetical protein
LATVLVVVVVAPGPLGGRWDSKSTLQLLAFLMVCLASR